MDIAWKTWANHQGKLRQLYEQGVSATDIGQYVERGQRLVESGVTVVDGLGMEFWKAIGSMSIKYPV